MILRYGVEGYGIYFHCLELIAGNVTNDNITFELEHDAEVIADNLKIVSSEKITSIEKVSQIMAYMLELGLFEESNNRIFGMRLAIEIDSSLIKNPKLKEIQMKIRDNPRFSQTTPVRLDKIRLDKNRIEETNITEKKKGCIKTILNIWNNLGNEYLPKHGVQTITRKFQKRHYDIINEYGTNTIIEAIQLYNQVLKSENHFFNYPWSLWYFIERGVDNFIPASNPLHKYKDSKKEEFIPNDPSKIKARVKEVKII